MSAKIMELNCPGCGASVAVSDKNCKFCKAPVVISTFDSVQHLTTPALNKYASTYQKALQDSPEDRDLNMSLAMVYLKLKLYDKAILAFEKAVENNFDNSEVFFYLAIALLQGKKAFLSTRAVIDKIEESLNASIMIEPKGIYYYLWAYIKYDYFERKSFVTAPNYTDMLNSGREATPTMSETDKAQLYQLLGVEKPDVL